MKHLLFLFLFLFICCCDRDNSDNKYTYDGKIDLFCEGLIYIEKDNINFIKPTNLDDTFLEQDLNVQVTFIYTGESENSCGGYVGNPKKIKIIKITKL